MKRGKYIQVKSSESRSLVMTQYSKESPFEMKVASENAFGLVIWVSEDGERLPVNCSHGGSMWLCWPCAQKLLAEQNQETGIERYWREQQAEHLRGEKP